MHVMYRILLFCLLASCSKAETDASDSQDTGHTGEVVYPSNYEAGKYRATSLALLPTGEGLDLTGDGEIDNVLPAKLPLVNAFTTDDLSFEGLNASLAESVANSSLIMLIEATYEQGELEYSVLLGAMDEAGVLSVDPVSIGADGSPSALFTGVFLDQTTVSATAEDAGVPFQFMPGSDPVLIPMKMARVEASLDDASTTAVLAGAIPVEAFISEVVEPLLPPEEEYDPADFNGKERDELLQQIRDIANMDSVSDIELENGERAFSAALTFTAELSNW
jgi:hypothetical protein